MSLLLRKKNTSRTKHLYSSYFLFGIVHLFGAMYKKMEQLCITMSSFSHLPLA